MVAENQSDLLLPEVIDQHFDWPCGRAAKMARRGQLPHYRLPDGDIRFRFDEVQSLVTHVPIRTTGKAVAHA